MKLLIHNDALPLGVGVSEIHNRGVLIQPIHETLTDEDLEKISSDLIETVNKKISGTLREE